MDKNTKLIALGFFGALVVVALLGVILLYHQTVSDYVTLEILGMKKDCGDDWACFEKYAARCKPVSVIRTEGLAMLKAKIYLETQGIDGNACKVYIETKEVPLIADAEDKGMVCRVTSSDIAQINRQNCSGPLADLLVTWKIW